MPARAVYLPAFIIATPAGGHTNVTIPPTTIKPIPPICAAEANLSANPSCSAQYLSINFWKELPLPKAFNWFILYSFCNSSILLPVVSSN